MILRTWGRILVRSIPPGWSSRLSIHLVLVGQSSGDSQCRIDHRSVTSLAMRLGPNGETAAKYGDAQVLVWRRSYDTPPPELEANDPRSERNDPRYTRFEPNPVPLTECLKDTVARVVPFWNEALAPAIKAGKRIVIAAHGNSIRALIKYLDGISDQDIVSLNIPNGIPLVYELDENLKPIRHYYLGDAEAAAKAAAAVATQGKA